MIKNLKRKGYESFTITIDGKVEYIHFWKGVQMKRLVIINLLLLLLFYILPQKEIVVEKEVIIQEQQKIYSRSLSEPRQDHFVADNKMIIDEEIELEQMTIKNLIIETKHIFIVCFYFFKKN